MKDRADASSNPHGDAAKVGDLDGLAVPPLPSCRIYLTLAGCLLTALFALLGVRLYGIQIVQHVEFANNVDRMMSAVERQHGRRGDIRSRDQTIWAREVRRYNVGIDPHPRFYSEVDRNDLIDVICAELDVPEDVRRRKVARLAENDAAVREGTAEQTRYLPLARRIDAERVARLQTTLHEVFEGPGKLDGLVLREVHHREYPKGPLLGTVLGSVGLGETADEIVGREGLELSLDTYLSSMDGHRIVLKDASMRSQKRFVWSDDIDIRAVDGHDVVLTIDSRIQRIASEELAVAVIEQRAEAGLVLVLSCDSADILALANYPSFDPNFVGRYPREEFSRRRVNRAIERQYEPGSTIKPLWAAAAIEHRLLRTDAVLWTGGKVTRLLGRRVADVSDHSPLTFGDAVVHSSNIGMAKVGLMLGRDRINDAMDRFHIGDKLGVLMPWELPGSRRMLADWSEKYTTISVSFGFALTVTPLQLGAAYVSLVNGGRYFTPRIVDRIERDGVAHAFPVEERGRPISERTSRKIRELLHRVVEEGTGRRFKIDGLSFGGKTGTAAFATGRRGYNVGGKEYLSSFIAYAPHPEPEYVIVAMVEKPKESYYGGTVCGPIVHNMLRRIYRVADAIE